MNKYEVMLEKFDRMSQSIVGFMTKIEDFINKVYDAMASYILGFGNHMIKLSDGLAKSILASYKMYRYITFPLHWIWIGLWFYLQKDKDENEPLNAIGVHYVQALAGGGKSTFMWQKMNDYAKMTGRCSYISTKLEKIKFNDQGKAYLNHIYFEPSEFFGKKEGSESNYGEQLKRFNSDLACCVAYDELHVLNNNRLNGTRENKQLFIPMINSFVLQRHFGINWILLGSQQPRNDSQIMNILQGYHKVQIKKAFIYTSWLLDGRFEKKVKGWSVRSYAVRIENDNLKLVSKRRWFKKATVSFDDFESLNMKDSLNHLPIDRKVVYA